MVLPDAAEAGWGERAAMRKSGSKRQWCGQCKRETAWAAYKRRQAKPSSRIEASGWQCSRCGDRQDTDVRIVSRDK